MESHVAVVRRFFEAGAARDVEGMAACWADDVVLHYAGRSPLAGTVRGKDAVLGVYGRMFEVTGGSFGLVRVDEVAAGDNRVVALFRVGAEREGRRFEWDAIEVFRVADGCIAEYWGFVADQYAVDEFLS